jgi:hypothetical protein
LARVAQTFVDIYLTIVAFKACGTIAAVSINAIKARCSILARGRQTIIDVGAGTILSRSRVAYSALARVHPRAHMSAVGIYVAVVFAPCTRVNGYLAQVAIKAEVAMAYESPHKVEAQRIVHAWIDFAFVNIFASIVCVASVAGRTRRACVGPVRIDARCQSATATVELLALINVDTTNGAVSRVTGNNSSCDVYAGWALPTEVRRRQICAVSNRIAATIIYRTFINIRTIRSVVRIASVALSARTCKVHMAHVVAYATIATVVQIPRTGVYIAAVIDNVCCRLIVFRS